MDQDSEDKESLARAQLPYRAEYCKTSRAKCKKCKEAMEANSLKLANMTKSRFHDGFDANFYHVKCFFEVKRPSSVAEIRYFETLRYDDQKMLEKAVETRGLSVLGDVVGNDDNGGVKKEPKPSKKSKNKPEKRQVESSGLLVNYNDFMLEYAKSNRSKCNLCDEKIDKDSVRLGKLDYDAETAWGGGPVPRWFHVECFVKSMEQLEFFGVVDRIKGFSDIEEEDQEMLKKKVKPIKDDRKNAIIDAAKKLKTEVNGNSHNVEEEEMQLKKQSDKLFALREILNTIKKKDLEMLLEHMRQKSNFRSPAQLVDAATDVLMFGPIERCPKCKKRGGMVLRGGGYICTKGASDSEECTYETREPKRNIPDIPEELIEKYPFFEDTYKFLGGKRLFSSKFIEAVEKKEAEDNNIVQVGAPLEGLSIGVIGWKGVGMDKAKVQKKITMLGGKIQTSLDKSLFVILTSEMQLEKEDPKVMVAKELDVPFVKAEFLFKINSKQDVVPALEGSLVRSWQGDLHSRFVELSDSKLSNNHQESAS